MQRRNSVRIVAQVALLLLGIAPAPALMPAASAARPCTGVEVIAHRGLHDRRHTEDTYAAFSRAMARGAAVVEGDVQLSADGSWVFLHDSTLGRTTHGRGQVRQRSDAYLASVRNNDGRVGLTFLPTALDLLRAHPGVRFEIEVKPADAPVERLEQLVGLLDGYGVTSRVLMTSRSAAVLDQLRQLSPGIQTGLITSDPGITATAAGSHGSTVVLGDHASRRPLVGALRAAGLRVETWTVDDHRDYRRAVRSRSDAVITDRYVDVRLWCRR